ncbi:MAG TPA: AmmeMemoRadiSam system protein A, partial [Candidatus Sulfotelmatobacter sp.]|nr:AmmeMemoRadiSam system protein A [Candidatus Sulfotelmatobacter sp.]
PHLAEPRGAFTSLYLRGQLRGCVGYVLPTNSVYRAVAETARAAAFEDTRFHPVNLDEARNLEIELSILSPPRPIDAESVEVGRHGLLIGMAGRRGLLLPQVPVERHWDRITFLEQTCRKAGLPLDAWQNGATIEAFTAEVFGEKH